MLSSSGGSAARTHLVRRGFTLAAVAALLLGPSLAGCAPEPPAQGPIAGPVEEDPTPTGTADPSTPQGDGTNPGDGTATGGSQDEDSAPDDTAPAAGSGTDGGDEGAPDPDINATDDWHAPDDPTAEGPTAAPALPEVNGAIGATVELPTEVTVTLTSITTTTLTAETPGEYTGPAVIVEVAVANDAVDAQPIDSAAISLIAEDGEMGIPTWADPNDPLRGEVPPGATAEGTYVFMLDPADERPVTVRVNYSAGVPVAVFTGTTP